MIKYILILFILIMIRAEEYKDLIESLTIGANVAEQDSFLEAAKVETPILNDFLADKVDFILGSKGSGKTSIFRLTQALRDPLLSKARLHLITGVEPQGNAVFDLFKRDFESFSESEFENFWKIYFINLVYNDFITNDSFTAQLKSCKSEIEELIKECARIGVPQITRNSSLSEIVQKTIAAINSKRIKKIKVSAITDANQPSLFTSTAEMEFEHKDNNVYKEKNDLPVYVNKIGLILEGLLKKTNIRIWVLLDRLDVVFEHGSRLEFFALRGLLRAYESFQVSAGSPFKFLRIKIFLRDDIFEFLLNPNQFKRISTYKVAKSLPALTHITSRATKTPLRWTKGEIQQLMLKRLFISPLLRTYFKTSIAELNNEKTRNDVWDTLFGKKIEPGDKKPDSLSWIYARLSDARQVTPRSAIDFLEGVIFEQNRLFKLDSIEQERFFSPSAVKHGIVTASKEKYGKETKNEYIKIVPYIEKIRGSSAQISNPDKIFGDNYLEIMTELEKIGLLYKVGDNYKVSFIFRAALDVHPQF